jgi:uncharacterized RDD family membrane protein YckC
VNCPECDELLEPGETRCPRCGERIEPIVRAAPEAPREPAVLRRGERAWREEVKDRVRERRRDRGIEEEDLPLFRQPTPPPLSLEDALEDDEQEAPLVASRAQPPAVRTHSRDTLADFDLRSDVPVATPPVSPRREDPREPDEVEPTSEDDWPLRARQAGEARAVERPASTMERAQAATIDLSVLLVLDAFILYFAARAARVDLPGLMVAWPYLAAYLSALALVYAAYFTGLMGRTPGKMILGLKVVDTHGQAPGFVRALLRTILGIAGSALLFIGHVPAFFDPARRALHDRLLGTRVVRT